MSIVGAVGNGGLQLSGVPQLRSAGPPGLPVFEGAHEASVPMSYSYQQSVSLPLDGTNDIVTQAKRDTDAVRQLAMK